jgi:two-component system sensor histidine kinase RegB
LRTSLGAAPVDSTQGGHGVGLYLAFSSAARLGGSIDLGDAPAQGNKGAASQEGSTSRPRKARGTRAVLRVPVTEGQVSEANLAAGSRNGAAAAL